MGMSAQRLLEKGINILDIIKISRGIYWHYVLHIGDGICVHVRKEDEEFVKVAEPLEDIAGDHFVEVHNPDLTAWLLLTTERSTSEAMQLAIDGLPLDGNGDVILGRPINVSYFVFSSNNCEGWCNYWKYNHESGWSMQVNNGLVHSTIGTVERLSDDVTATLKEAISDEDTPVAVKAIAAVSIVPSAGISYVAAGVRHTTDAIVSVFKSWWNNPYYED